MLLATGGIAWQFLVSPRLSCIQAADPTRTGAATEYCLPGNERNYGAMTVGPDGNPWFMDSGKIARITPNGAVTRFTLPHDRDVTAITSGPDGGVWFLLVDSDVLPFVINSTRVVRITP